MADVTQELVRLAQLRAAGMLTEAEFEQEKQLLFNGLIISPAKVRPQLSLIVRIFAALGFFAFLIVIVALAGWLHNSDTGRGAQAINGVAAQAAGQNLTGSVADLGNAIDEAKAGLDHHADGITAPEASGWTITTKRDPMNDWQVTTAAARFVPSPFVVDVAIVCTAGRELTYRLTSFDDNGAPAPIQLSGGSWAHYSVRVDDGAAQTAADEPIYSNVFEFRTMAEMPAPPAETAVRAKKIAIALQLLNGEPVIVLDQTDPSLRSMLTRCAQSIEATRKRMSEIVAARRACEARVAEAKAADSPLSKPGDVNLTYEDLMRLSTKKYENCDR